MSRVTFAWEVAGELSLSLYRIMPHGRAEIVCKSYIGHKKQRAGEA